MSAPFSLAGKVALVTGASRGIGRAIAETYAAAGAAVVISGRRAETLARVAEAMRHAGHEVTPIVAHNGDKAALQALAQQTAEKYGAVDILVHNAATNPHFGPLLEAEDSMWQKTLEVNLLGVFWLTQAVVPMMQARGAGKIIIISSINGLRPGRGQGIYSVTKAALISLTQTLAMELGPDDIQVNAIAPGLIQTAFARALWQDDALRESVEGRTPLGRIGQPPDLTGIALYLASDAANFTTGQTFVVDGGVSIAAF
ncbi:MAG: glucose 1-dehydrogenase [Anaerolineaceae bacterium]|nr:glucose 1-dehydrogenase [Anaerolineaceae bacterium]MCY4107108.1 glucose 1-dehydrogenase [Chloroflexota bacterium]